MALGRRWGVFVCQAGTLSLRDPVQVRGRGLHSLRESWRLMQFRSRRDAEIAGAEGLVISRRLVTRLHKLAMKLPGHAVACMVGVCSTDARWSPSGPIRDRCELCGEAETPSLRHVMWMCSATAHLRSISEPVSAARVERSGLRQGARRSLAATDGQHTRGRSDFALEARGMGPAVRNASLSCRGSCGSCFLAGFSTCRLLCVSGRS